MRTSRTVMVIYTDKVLKNKKEIAAAKKYSFNTTADVEEGDLIDSPNYTTSMQVVKVLDTRFTFYNRVTGELSHEYTNTNQWEIRNLKIVDIDTPEDIVGYKVTK